MNVCMYKRMIFGGGFGVRDMYMCMLFSMCKDLFLEVGLGLKICIYAASLYV